MKFLNPLTPVLRDDTLPVRRLKTNLLDMEVRRIKQPTFQLSDEASQVGVFDLLQFNGTNGIAQGAGNSAVISITEQGTWVPNDQSGAGLGFTTLIAAEYIKIGKLIFATMAIQYPATASGANASIGGLPYTVGNTYGGGTPYTDAAQAIILAPNPATTLMTVVPTFGGGAITNIQLTGKIVIAALTYISA